VNKVHFKLVAPPIPQTIRGVGYSLKLLHNLADGSRLAACEETCQKPARTSAHVLTGFILPPTICEEKFEKDPPKEVVIKFPSDCYRDNLAKNKREADSLIALSGPEGIPRCLYRGEQKIESDNGVLSESIEQWDAPYFVMNRVAGQPLSHFSLPKEAVGALADPRFILLVAIILPGFAERLAAIHQAGFVHRDVKPTNALYDKADGTVSVVDFELALPIGQGYNEEDTGAMVYLAPEVARGYSREINPRSDIYSFGLTCFRLLTGEKMLLYKDATNPLEAPNEPFAFESELETYFAEINNMRYISLEELIEQSNLPPAYKNSPLGRIIMRCLHPDPNQRYTNLHQFAAEIRKL